MESTVKRRVRELEVRDIDLMVNYFLQADLVFLKGMGVEPQKLPSLAEWHQLLQKDLKRPKVAKAFYYLIWEIDDEPVGHSNLNKIICGHEAYMHLHLWQSKHRRRGHGTALIEQSVDCYFTEFQLRTLWCEPYALNPAPNRALPKVGFDLIKTYEPEPGWINYPHPVNRWGLTIERWLRRSQDVDDWNAENP